MIKVFGYYVSKIYLYLGIVEAGVFAVAFHLGALARFGWHLPSDMTWWSFLLTSLLFALGLTTSMIAMGLYQRGVQEREAGFLVRLGLAFLLGTTLAALAFYALPIFFIGRGAFGMGLVFSFIGIILVRETFWRIAGAESQKRRVLVLGAGVNAQRIEELARQDSALGFVVVGYVPLPRSQLLIDQSKVIERDRPLLELAIAYGVDEIVVGADDRRRKLPVGDLLDCKMSGFEVLDLLTFFEKELALVKIDLLHPSWIFFSTNGFRMGVTGLYGKRMFDIALALLMLVVASPLMIGVAVASLIESRGRDPIFYSQVRVGQNGMPFRVHKFRSMRVDAEADGRAVWASKNDARVTKLGQFIRKTRLDELPQIFNVLRGEMSLVGPRPERPEFVEQLEASISYYAERHRVKPGVTGWAQLLYPYGSDVEDAKRKLEFDLYYVKHAGVVLDLIIFLQTVEVVLLGKGAR